jgi:hypothetical protein
VAYARLPTDEELASSGFALDDYLETAEVWPENWPIFSLFLNLQTQWQTGMAGSVGLRYEALYPLLDRHFADDWQQAFDDMRVMERAALEAMRD